MFTRYAPLFVVVYLQIVLSGANCCPIVHSKKKFYFFFFIYSIYLFQKRLYFAFEPFTPPADLVL